MLTTQTLKNSTPHCNIRSQNKQGHCDCGCSQSRTSLVRTCKGEYKHARLAGREINWIELRMGFLSRRRWLISLPQSLAMRCSKVCPDVARLDVLDVVGQESRTGSRKVRLQSWSRSLRRWRVFCTVLCAERSMRASWDNALREGLHEADGRIPRRSALSGSRNLMVP